VWPQDGTTIEVDSGAWSLRRMGVIHAAIISRTAVITICLLVDVNEPAIRTNQLHGTQTIFIWAQARRGAYWLPPGKYTLQLVLSDAGHYPSNQLPSRSGGRRDP
jgi:hypothetical protein